MRKEERDRLMRDMSPEQRADFRHLISQLRSEMKATPGGRVPVRALVASGRVDVPPHLREAAAALMERDDIGPQVGQPAPDFSLKRLESQERVRLSSFQGTQPVAIVFGSYT